MSVKTQLDGETSSTQQSGETTQKGEGFFETGELQSLEKDLKLCPFVFVYGTLKFGYSNNSLLRDATFISSTTTKSRFALGNVGFPFAFPSDVVPKEYEKLLYPVSGELYKIEDPWTFATLDGLEGYPSLYNRRITQTEYGEKAWMYTMERWENAVRCTVCTLTGKGEWVWP